MKFEQNWSSSCLVLEQTKTRAVNKCVNTPASPLTDTCILYTDGLTHGQTDTWMDRQADYSLPLKTFILPGYNKEMFTNMGMVLFLLKWKKDLVKRNRLKQDFLSRIRDNNSLTLDRISQNLQLAHLRLLMKTSARYTVNQTETVGVVRGNNPVILDGIFTKNLCLAHLQLQMDTSAKFKANQTEIAGGVVWTTILNVNQG